MGGRCVVSAACGYVPAWSMLCRAAVLHGIPYHHDARQLVLLGG